MKRIRIWVLLLWILLPLCSSHADSQPAWYGAYGTAKWISGRTVIVSVFADDTANRWDFDSRSDKEIYTKAYKRMEIGMAWLQKQVRARTKNKAQIIWDWINNDGLYYRARLSGNLTDSSSTYSVLTEYIRQSVDIEGIMRKYEADNILFAFFVNAPSSDRYRSYTYCANFSEIEKNKVYYEACVFFPYARGREATPALYAHEILHTFGAYDLYETYDGSPITQSYIDYLTKRKVKDLMNQCIWDRFDRVTVKFSDVDAYYVGIGRYQNAFKKWNLGPSIYDRWPK